MSDAFLDAAAPMIAGMLVQVFLLLRPTAADARDLGICLLGALLAFLPFKHEVDYEPARHVFFACLLFVWMLTFVFRDRLLPRIQEGIVIVWTCLFVYSAYSAIGLLHPAGWLLLAVSLFVLVILALRMTFAFAAKHSI